MEHQITERPGITVLGMKYRGAPGNPEIPKLWDRFIPRENEIQHRSDPHVGYGIMGRYDQATNTFDYLAGVPVTKTDDIPDGMETWELPAGKYAVFTTCLKTLHRDMDTIYGQWFPNSGYQHADTPDFELYDGDFRGGDEDPVYVYIAIQ
jgi:AraC family transcriptional regulator